MPRRWGWAGPGPTDWTVPTYSVAQANHVDHIERMTLHIPARDQKQEGSCVGFGWTRTVQAVAQTGPLSPAFAYFATRVLEGSEGSDDGCVIADAWKAYAQYGVASEAAYPYVEGQFSQRPTLDAFADGMGMKGKVVAKKLRGTNALLHALAAGHPVVFGFSVSSYFETPEMEQSGYLPLPTSDDSFVGGHCVVADGYDLRDNEQFVWVANSWSSSWGPFDGWFKLDLKWFSDSRRLVDDLWCVMPA